MNSSAAKIKMPSVDDLFGLGSEINKPLQPELDKVVYMPLSSMHDFKGHPFRVIDDVKMAETVESIKKFGILVPGIIRPDPAGGYETVAGHRRRRAAALAGLDEIPVIIKELTDDEATVIMVDSNIQREDILPSEKAYAYKMKYDALKRLGKLEQDGECTGKKRSDQVLAEQSGESRNTIQRYIRLTYLHIDFLKMVDTGKLPKNTAADLSYLHPYEQEELLEVMKEIGIVPSAVQALKLKDYSKEKRITKTVMELVLKGPEKPEKVSLKEKDLRRYFPPEYTGEQIEKVIFSLLQEWQKKIRS